MAKVTIVREGDRGLESRVFWHLVEDGASFNGGTFSYEEFVKFVNSGGGGRAGAGPPGGPSRVRVNDKVCIVSTFYLALFCLQILCFNCVRM